MNENIENFSEPNVEFACLSDGICSVDPILFSLDSLFLNEARQISYYLIKSADFGYTNHEAQKKCIELLTYELANSNLNEDCFKQVLADAVKFKDEIKSVYLYLCENSPQGMEIIDFPLKINPKKQLMELVRESEKIIYNKHKTLSKKTLQYFELITLVTKICAENILKIKSYNPDFNKFDFELLKFFSLTNLYYPKEEKLKKKILEFSDTIYNIREELNKVISLRFGKRHSTKIQTVQCKGKSLLVSGCDILELERILELTKNLKINIYTHGELLLAHSFEGFKKYKNLKGHLDTGSIKYDFSNFDGIIYITKYMPQKVEQLYKGIVFSAEKITPKGFIRIENNDYSTFLEYIKKLKPASGTSKIVFHKLQYDFEIFNKVLESDEDSLVLFVGENANFKPIEYFGDKKVINLHYQSDSDLIHYVINKSEEKGIPLFSFFSKCSPRIITGIISLANKNVKTIYLIKCSSSGINPHILECLQDSFDVKIIN